MKKIFLLSLTIAVCMFFAGTGYAQSKPTITVYGFDVKASSGFWHDAKWDIGTGMGEMLVDALVNTGKFNVVERLNIGDITFEQDLVDQGRVSKKTGAKKGRMTGASYIARGTITEFDVTESGGGGGISIKGISLGVAQSFAHIGGIIRIYDSTTGEIYKSQRFTRDVPATGFSIGYNRGMIGADLGAFKKTPLGEATNLAIHDIVDFMVANITLEGATWTCGKCGAKVAGDAEFCHKCGATRAEEALYNCPFCGQELEPGAKFCDNCGKQLKDVKCPKCGKKLKPGTSFCPDCGIKVGQSSNVESPE